PLCHVPPLIPLHLLSYFSFPIIRPPPKPPLFPYTTLFRSTRGPRCTQVPGRCPKERTSPGPSNAPSARRTFLAPIASGQARSPRSEEHTSELQSLTNIVCRLLLEKQNHT